MRQQLRSYKFSLFNSSLAFFTISSSTLSNATIFNSSLEMIYSGDQTNDVEAFAPVHGAAKLMCHIVYTLILVSGILGNAIVLYVLGYRKKKRNSGDLYVLSLAGTDFLSSLIVAAFMLNDIITDFSGWIYGEELCHLFSGVVPATMCASGWFLALISFDRYRIVSTPMAHEPRRSVLILSIGFVWLSSIAVILPQNLQLEASGNVCLSTNYSILDKHSSFIGVAIWAVYSMVIPNFIIFIVYCLTARALKENTVRHDNHRAMEQIDKQNARIVRMFVIIVIAFCVLTMPYAIFCLYASYALGYDISNSNRRVINKLNYVLLIPASANCCVNPIIYAKMHREINGYLRRTIQRIIGVCCRCTSMTIDIAFARSVNYAVPIPKSYQSEV